MRQLWWAGLIATAAMACGNDIEKGGVVLDGGVPAGTVDDRVPIPDPDPNYFDIVTPEAVIQPGQETMFCLHLENDVGDLAIVHLVGEQGTGGHHIALFTTTDPQPAGTVEDCTSPDANAKLQWFILTFNGLPAGHAIHVPQGMHYVLQYHYINASDYPILIRDVARLQKVDPATVTTWVSTLISTKINLAIPPGTSSISFDCTVDQDRDLLVACGHMHEMGHRFTLDVGATTSTLKNIYTVDPWQGTFRDSPPSVDYYDQPLHLAAGSVVRTTCEWENTNDQTLGFPQEMCTTFAYAAGPQQLLQCVAN